MELNRQLLGAGDFGCVYKPPLCFNTGDPDYLVGKVTTPDNVKTELAVSAIIHTCKDCEKYFGVLTGDSCSPKLTETVLDECKSIRDKPKELILSYSSRYLGTPLSDYDFGKSTVDWLYSQFTHLLKGLLLLQNLHILHADIKADNILIDDDGVCRIIDFGLAAINPQDKRSLDDSLYPRFHPIYPPWYNAYIETTERLERTRILYENTYGPYMWEARPLERKNFVGALILDSQTNAFVKDVVLPNIYKVDVYSLALLFKSIYDLARRIYIRQNSKKCKCLEDVFSKILVFSAKEQYDAKQALTELAACQ